MRLIRIPSMALYEYHGEDIPPYAILSHRWGDEEVSFSDFQEGRGPTMKGYQKIIGCCNQAVSDGLDAWIDTCCIDKRSSAELSEAINSMFKWYRNAAICYAYLDDVISDYDSADVPRLPATFSDSLWFTRGWTLQELLAPSAVVFYSVEWINIGSRGDLAGIIAKTTRIDLRFFESGKFDDFSIAQRMSWASQRQTTRIEDQAYCLLGLFGVNMPLLYGEGEQAFIRLQLEIMKESDDQTIFAWALNESMPSWNLEGGILAPSPMAFADSGHIVRSQTDEIYRPYAATNKGLQISLPLLGGDTTATLVPSGWIDGATIPRLTLTASHGNIAVLNCQPFNDGEARVGIYVEQQREHGSYIRVNYRDGINLVPFENARKEVTQKDLLIQLRNEVVQTSVALLDEKNRRLIIRPFNSLASQFKLSRTTPREGWQRQPTSPVFLDSTAAENLASPPKQNRKVELQLQSTGFLSSVFSDFSSAVVGGPKLLEYADAEGHKFVLILQKRVEAGKATHLEAFIAENADMATDEAGVQAQVRDAIYMAQNHGPSRNQQSSHGLLAIEPKIIEARHASIISIEARRATSATHENKLSLNLMPPSPNPKS